MNPKLPKKIILSIDDCLETLQIQKYILENEGYEVHTFSSGPLALEILPHLARIDLIILDYEMEGMSGPDFLGIMKNPEKTAYHSIPIVFMSAHEHSPANISIPWIPKLKDVNSFLLDVAKLINNERP